MSDLFYAGSLVIFWAICVMLVRGLAALATGPAGRSS